MKCPNCDREIIEGAAFCGHCGTSLRAPAEEAPAPQPPPRVCPCCGSTMREQSRFCARCGAPAGAPLGAVPPVPMPPPAMPNASVPPSFLPTGQGKKKGKAKLIAALLLVLLLGAVVTTGYFAVSGGWDIQSVLPAFLQWGKAESQPEDSSASESLSSSSLPEPPVSQSSSQPPVQQDAPSPVAGYWRWETNDENLASGDIFWHFTEDGMVEAYYAGETAESFEGEEVQDWWYFYDQEKELLYVYADEADMEGSDEEIIWDGNDRFTVFEEGESELFYTWVRVSKNDVPPDAVRIALG